MSNYHDMPVAYRGGRLSRYPPSGYGKFIVGSRQGWGGRKSCSGGKNYNYYCKDSIPDPFTNCAWTGHEISFVNTQYCSDSCPSGSIRITEELISTLFGNDKTAHASNCYHGMEAYCCNGITTTNKWVHARPTLIELWSCKRFISFLLCLYHHSAYFFQALDYPKKRCITF